MYAPETLNVMRFKYCVEYFRMGQSSVDDGTRCRGSDVRRRQMAMRCAAPGRERGARAGQGGCARRLSRWKLRRRAQDATSR